MQPAEFQFECPYCRRLLSATNGMLGTQVACVYCNGVIQLVVPPPLPSEAEPPPPSFPQLYDHGIAPPPSPNREAIGSHPDDDCVVWIGFDGRIFPKWQTAPEAKLAIKHLKILKKEIKLKRQAICREQRTVRANHTAGNRQRGAAPRGRGIIAGIFRTIHQVDKGLANSSLANSIASLEVQKEKIDRIVLDIDTVIVQAETFIALG